MGLFDDIRKAVRRIPGGQRFATMGEVGQGCRATRNARGRCLGLGTLPPWKSPGKGSWSGGKFSCPGRGLHQRMLLEMEGVSFFRQRVNMRRCEYRFRPQRLTG